MISTVVVVVVVVVVAVVVVVVVVVVPGVDVVVVVVGGPVVGFRVEVLVRGDAGCWVCELNVDATDDATTV